MSPAKRLPEPSDFPSSIKLSIVLPPDGKPPTNVLLLLHGLGDTHASFTNLGRQLNLPETACISIQAPKTLLDLGGYHWGDDIIFDNTTGGLDADAGFKETDALLHAAVQDVLVAKCGYEARDVMVFGFGQGGMAALNYVLTLPSALAGAISIGAGLPSSAPAALVAKNTTPVLVCAGQEGDSAVTASSEEKLQRVFAHVQIARYRRPGDTMPRDRDEMMPVMRFFARGLRSRAGVPEGAVEVGDVR